MITRLGSLCIFVLIITAVIEQRPAGAVSAPVTDQSIVATFVAGEVALTGAGFGEATSGALAFATDGGAIVVTGTSANVATWADSEIVVTLPHDVRSGTLTVVAGETPSEPVDVLVYEYTSHSTTIASNPHALPLALDIDADGTLWINEEFHRDLKSLTNDGVPVLASWAIPQAEGGIFAHTSDDTRTDISTLGEDIDVAPDGSVWFTQGGGFLYNGERTNASRIVRFDPNTDQFDCYNVPNDHAEALGVLIDEARGLVWYSESGYWDGNAITSFSIADAGSDCEWDPFTTAPPPICQAEAVAGCHRRYELPHANSYPAHLALDESGDIWFTEFWANRIGRLDPESGDIVELPVPRHIVKQGPGIYAGAGMWELFFDAAGMLWVSEHFDATILRVDPSQIESAGCTTLDASAANPCIEEMFVGTDGYDGAEIHTISLGADGRVWFGHSRSDGARVGFIDTQQNDEVVFLPGISTTMISGIIEDPSTGDVWFGEFNDQRIGRLQLARGDADGVAASVDNCPDVYNPGQENNDRDFVALRQYNKVYDDMTWPQSDLTGDACDDDRDNDGLPNDVESSLPGAACPAASAPTSPDLRDTDGDMALDGAECLFGRDPADPNSVPPRIVSDDGDHDGLSRVVEVALGLSPEQSDTDGDGVHDGLELLNYGSSPSSGDSDGDGCSDGRETVSVNGDRNVDAVDLQQIAIGFGLPGAPRYVPHFDLNRDGRISSLDLSLVTTKFGPCP